MIEILLLLLLVVGLIFSLPIVVPLAAVLSSRKRWNRRLRAAVQRGDCPRCGRVLGLNALKEADRAWEEHVARLRSKRSGEWFQPRRDVRAVCRSCGMRYGFDEVDRRFFSLDG